MIEDKLSESLVSELIKENFTQMGNEIAELLVNMELANADNPEILSIITTINTELSGELDEILFKHQEKILTGVKADPQSIKYRF